MVVPIFSYGCEVWGPFELKGLNSSNFLNLCESSPIEKRNTKMCKYLLGINKYSCNLAAKGELGSHGLLIQCICKSMKYWVRFLKDSMDCNSLVYKSYCENRRLETSQNWSHFMNITLSNLGMSNIWLNENLGSYNEKS